MVFCGHWYLELGVPQPLKDVISVPINGGMNNNWISDDLTWELGLEWTLCFRCCVHVLLLFLGKDWNVCSACLCFLQKYCDADAPLVSLNNNSVQIR